jgi:hypothetical protein
MLSVVLDVISRQYDSHLFLVLALYKDRPSVVNVNHVPVIGNYLRAMVVPKAILDDYLETRLLDTPLDLGETHN